MELENLYTGLKDIYEGNYLSPETITYLTLLKPDSSTIEVYYDPEKDYGRITDTEEFAENEIKLAQYDTKSETFSYIRAGRI